MHIGHTLKTAYKGLIANKFRSFLTILGINIGITSIILIVSIGAGAENLILGQIKNMGSNNIFILPGKMAGGMSGSFHTIMDDSLKERDLELLQDKRNVPHVTEIMPIVFGSELAKNGKEVFRGMYLGTTDKMLKMYDIYPEQGRDISDSDIASKASVAVIGNKVKEELFPDQREVVGEKIRIKSRSFRIIGVLSKEGQVGFADFDESIILPYTTAQQYLSGEKHFNRLIVEIDSEENVKQSIKDIEMTLRNSHNIEDPEKDDFTIQTTESLMDSISVVTGVLTLFLAAVASISLLVGGVGIMNIVLVSVSERTKEIGLRKSLGATKKDIMYQFLFESMFLTITGGVSGIILGTLFSWIASFLLTNFANLAWPFSFSTPAALVGFFVAAGVGLVFGLYPAKKAAELSPIEALRRE